MKVNEIVQIVDLETGEILRHSSKKAEFVGTRLQYFQYFFEEFCELIRDGRSVGLNVSCFDIRINQNDAYDLFVTNKKREDIF